MLPGTLSFGTGVGLAVFALVAVLLDKTMPGWGSILIPISLFGALQSLSLGVLSEYFVRLIFRRSLPDYVVQSASLKRTKPRR